MQPFLIKIHDMRSVLADLQGKGRRIRTVAIPIWVKQGIDAWLTAARTMRCSFESYLS